MLNKFCFKKLFIFLIVQICRANSDLVIVGPMKQADGIFRLSISWIEQLKNNLKIDFISTGYVNLDEVNTNVKQIVLECLDNIDSINKTPAKVALLLSSPWTIWGNHHECVPNSTIKIAYSMLEGTKIPDEWVQCFNNKFDLVVVPDVFLVKIYKNCGVKIPIFVLPISLKLDNFLNSALKTKRNEIFRFGVSASFIPDKNHEITLQAFIKLFKNNDKVELWLHGRGGDHSSLEKTIERLNLKNVHLINKCFSEKEYFDFISSLDCYILLSKGEGFSITPREAMALGIPCILSNNTAHITICKTGLVEVVKSKILEPAYYVPFESFVGYKFNCSIKDVCIALKKVYNNYNEFLKNANKRRDWAKQYNYTSLKQKCLTLIKPKKILFGSENRIENDIFITNSANLYDKYSKLIYK